MAVCDDFIHCECASIVEEMEWEQSELRKARDELLEALECYVEKVADLNRYGVMIETSVREKAEAAIAKAKGERRVLPSPQGPDSFSIEAVRSAIAKAKGE